MGAAGKARKAWAVTDGSGAILVWSVRPSRTDAREELTAMFRDGFVNDRSARASAKKAGYRIVRVKVDVS